MEQSLARIAFSFQLGSAELPPYSLYTIRNRFRDEFRARACRVDETCEKCRDRDCPYYLVFSQKVAEDPEGKKRHQKPPLPFAFGFPLLSPDRSSAVLEATLTLVGSALPHIDLFVQAFAAVLAAPPFSGKLLRTESLSPFGQRAPLYPGEGGAPQPILLPLDEFLRSAPPGPGGTLTFHSPLRLVRNGKEISSFDLPLLLRTLLRRVSSMLYYYCGLSLPDDFAWLSARCDELSPRSVAFSPARGVNGSPGITGSAVVDGDLAELYPFLLLGEFLNVGKGAAYGHGRFVLTSATS